MINWLSSSTEILFNHKISLEEKEHYKVALDQFALPAHVWVATSGSTGRFKWVALSKEAILASGDAVNSHIGAKREDKWIHALPNFHVGGIGIWARAYLLGAEVVDFKKLHPKWNPQAFYECSHQEKISFAALVPTQVYDLVSCSNEAPASLKATVVGGGALTKGLYEAAQKLGWNLLSSYGLTECASQVATAVPGDFDNYQILNHVGVRVDQDNTVCLKSPSLFTAYAVFNARGEVEWVDPKKEGWFQTEDKGELLSNGGLKIFGREKDFIKVSGESVNLLSLQRIIDELAWKLSLKGLFVISGLPDERLGHVVHLAVEEGISKVDQLVEAFNGEVLPYETIKKVHQVKKIPLTPIGKVDHGELRRALS